MSSSSSFFSGTNPTPTEYQTAVDLVAQATQSATNSLASAAASATSATSSENYAIEADNSATIAANQAEAAATSSAGALTYKTDAETAATTATTQAGIATTQAGIATTQATNASNSATDANTSATAASTSATNAASSASAAATSASNAATTLAGALVKTSNLSDLSNVSTARTNLGLAIGTNVQAYDADLASIAGLTGTTGLLKKTAANTWSLDTTSYLSGNIPISTGVSGLGTNVSTALTNATNAANGVVQLTSLGKLPALDGSSLTGLLTTVNNSNWSGSQLTVANGGTGATTLTGLVKGNGTSAFTAATAGTDYVVPGGALGTPSSGNLANCTPPSARVVTIANGTSITMNADTTDIAVQVNTQAAGTLTINAPTGTPVNGQKLILRLQSTSTQVFSWNAIFSAGNEIALPSASSAGSKYDYMGFIYNAQASKWHIVARIFGY